MGIQRERGALLDLITRAAEAGAAIIREGAGRLGTIDWQSKGPGDFVSEVDLRTEAAILARLRSPSPGSPSSPRNRRRAWEPRPVRGSAW